MKNPILAIVFALLFFVQVQPAFAHGTVSDPISRIYYCYNNNPENPTSDACKAAKDIGGSQPFYDWNEINQPNIPCDSAINICNENDKCNHKEFVTDGHLASGDRDKYAGMDLVRSDWSTTAVSAGEFNVTWKITAPHATRYYEVYITKDNWNPSQALTWDSLELLKRTPPSPAEPESYSIPVNLPARTGHHVIYSVWQRCDSGEAFYSTSDVCFGTCNSVSTTNPVDNNTQLGNTGTNPQNTNYPEWQGVVGTTYNQGDKVTYEGKSYECLQTHTYNGDPNWAPGVAHSLWKEI